MLNLFASSSEFTPEDAARMRRIEGKIDLILNNLGLTYREDMSDVPPLTREYMAKGNKIAAIKAYRQATGAGLSESKRAVEGFMARQAASG